ncbi:MAG: cyclic nucleotide-binding domain-containing protein [Acidimicrobiia bacterium]
MALRRHKEYTDNLKAVPLFEGLSDRELGFLAGVTTETSVKEGSTLVKQGELGQEAMIIEKGTASVTRDGAEIDTIGPGDFFGEMSLINSQPRNAGVVATSDMTLLVMDSREFSSVLDKYPEVAVKILKTVVARLVKAQESTV